MSLQKKINSIFRGVVFSSAILIVFFILLFLILNGDKNTSEETIQFFEFSMYSTNQAIGAILLFILSIGSIIWTLISFED